MSRSLEIALRRFPQPAVAALLLTAATAGMLFWSWLQWPDVLIDYGRQLYLAWRLSEGAVLYRDLEYAYGPLPQYVGALAFHAFGVALSTLVAVNVAVFGCIVAASHWLLLRIGTAWSALVSSLVLVMLFGFQQLLPIGNYNYATPYETSATFGLALGLAALVGFDRFLQTRSRASARVAGLCLGLCFLTKPEPFSAAAGAIAAGAALFAWRDPNGRRAVARELPGFALAALLPLAVCVGLLSLAMPFEQALRGSLGSWGELVRPAVVTIPFNLRLMGLDDPAGNLVRMGAATLLHGLCFGALIGLAVLLRNQRSPVVPIAAFLAVLLLGTYLAPGAAVEAQPRVLPIAMLLSGGLLLRALLRNDGDAARRIAQLSFVVFALLLLTRMLLHPRIAHYGFVLAMPSTLILVTALLAWIPSRLTRQWGAGAGALFGTVSAAAILAAGSHIFGVSQANFARKSILVENRGDRILTDRRGIFVNRALRLIEERAGADQTLVVLPDGISLNYLTRRANPTRFSNFSPGAFLIRGDEAILDEFRLSPPDFILVIRRTMSDHGYGYIGEAYAQELFAWIHANYRRHALIGSPPFEQARFGILVLERIAPEE